MVTAAVEKDNLYIPLIDFSPFLHGTPEEKAAVGKAVVDGFRTAGFIYLKNHGITPDQVSNMFKRSAQFFDLTQEQKDKLEWYSPEANRGYSGHGKEKVSLAELADKVQELREQVPDLKESMEIGRDDEKEYPNMWPPADYGSKGWSETFKTESKEFFDICKRFHMEVMRAIAVGLGIDDGWFDGFTDQGDNTLRLLHYPSVSREVFERNNMQVRAGAHSDYGSVTLLFQDSRGGLQVESPNGTYVDATPIPHTIVVNAGDLLARWSNDLIKSTKHRVVEPPNKADEYPARYSIAYFCNPNFNKNVDVIPGTLAEGQTKKYETINSGQYLVKRLTETY